MGKTSLSPARVLAYECLEESRKRDAYSRVILDKMLENSDLDSTDKAFATRLTLGVTSTIGSIDEYLNSCMRSPRDVKPRLRTALRIAAYEMLFMDKEPYAAVDQGVALASKYVPKATGVANAILRKAAEALDTFPKAEDARDLEELARACGFPYWLASKIADEHGEEAATSIVLSSNDPAPIFVATNSIKASDCEIKEVFAEVGCSLALQTINDETLNGCYLLEDGLLLHDRKIKNLLNDGKILIADAAAQYIASCASRAVCDNDQNASKKGVSVLELCCGRGTKTILLQDRFNRFAVELERFISIDNVDFKVELAIDRAKSYGVILDEALCADLSVSRDCDSMAKEMGQFDLVFLDAPCSGSGTLRRHPEIRWRLSPSDIEELVQLQSRLLSNAVKFVNDNGLLVYSTCSLLKEENENVIDGFLSSKQGSSFKLLNSSYTGLRQSESAEFDSHFVAIFKNYL